MAETAEDAPEQGSNLPTDGRTEILHGLFGDIGEVYREDFSCAVEINVLIHGRLYLSSNAVCFYSNLFGVEKKIKLPYSAIKWYSKINTALIIPNAIEIKSEETTYQFRSFLSRNKVFHLIEQYMSKLHGDEPEAHADMTAPVDEETAKMNVFQKLMDGFTQRRRSSAGNNKAAASAAAAASTVEGTNQTATEAAANYH